MPCQLTDKSADIKRSNLCLSKIFPLPNIILIGLISREIFKQEDNAVAAV